MKLKLALIVIFNLFLFGCAGHQTTVRSQFLMGTVVEVTSSFPEAADIVFNEFKALEGKLSHFKPKSAIAQLNTEGEKVLDKETFSLIKKSLEISAASNGAFDITCAPLVDIWKQAIASKTMPSKKDIQRALSLVGWKDVSIDEKKCLVRFRRKGMKLDLGGIGEGFAVDKAVERLRQHGVTSALINAGGDIYCLGTNSGAAWKVGVRHPRQQEQIIKVYSLINKAITTSGDYEQFFTFGKRRYSHIIDPRTGYPVDNGICSVTIIGLDCTTADVLATTIFVLGEEEGKKLARKFNITEFEIIKVNQL